MVKDLPLKDAKIVAIGGGTGLPTTLKACRSLTTHLTAIVSVADNGGSSGRLRNDYSMPPPGDIRNCLLALAGNEKMRDLFAYRFDSGADLMGHSLGNLIIAALYKTNNDFVDSIRQAGEFLDTVGDVLPVTDMGVDIGARFTDGAEILGQVEIINYSGDIESIYIKPADVKCAEEACIAVEEADHIIIGPGSLYTSLIATLVTGNLFELIYESQARVIYIMNAMTQPGETAGFSAADHIRAIFQHTIEGFMDDLVISKTKLPEEVISAYERYGASQVVNNVARGGCGGIRLHSYDLLNTGLLVRHDPQKMADMLIDLLCPSTAK